MAGIGAKDIKATAPCAAMNRPRAVRTRSFFIRASLRRGPPTLSIPAPRTVTEITRCRFSRR